MPRFVCKNPAGQDLEFEGAHVHFEPGDSITVTEEFAPSFREASNNWEEATKTMTVAEPKQAKKKKGNS